jgi:hypothetical protein
MVTIAELRGKLSIAPAPIQRPHAGPSRSARRKRARSEQRSNIVRFYREIGVSPNQRFRLGLAVARIGKQLKIEKRLPVVADLCPIIMSVDVLHGVEAWISKRLGLMPPDSLHRTGSSVLPSSPPALPPPTPPAPPHEQHSIYLMLCVVASVREVA